MKTNTSTPGVFASFNPAVGGRLIALPFAIALALMSAVSHSSDALDRPITISIPPDTPLEDALLEWGNKTGVQVMMDSPSVAREHTHTAIEGTQPAHAVLLSLLSQAKLSYTMENTTVHVVQASDVAPESPSPPKDTAGKAGTPPKKALAGTGSANTDARRQENLEEVIVTAQKRTERLQDVPVSISVLGGSDLDRSTFSGVTDAINSVPGVSAFDNQFQAGGTQLSFRGVSAAQTFFGGASTVGYYVDSVPFGMIRSALVPDPNVYDLSRIEVLRGPQGTLYGANALNGVVRVLTNDADLDEFDFKARGSLSTTEGGGANYGGALAVNMPIVNGRLAARAVLGDDHESGWIDGPLGTNRNSGELSNARLKVRWKATDELSVDLFGWHSQQSYNALAIADNSGHSLAISPEPSYTQFNAYGAKLTYELPRVSITSMTSYVGYENHNRLDATPVIQMTNLGTDFTSRVYSEEVDMTSKLEGPWKWTAGAMYRDDKDTIYQPGFNYPNPVPYILFENEADTSKSAAVYGELGRQFLDGKLQATIGVRYFHDDESNVPLSTLPAFNVTALTRITATSSATTPRATLTWTPTRDVTAYFAYSQGFRSGMPQDELIGAVVPNYPPLKPDKLINYEAGVKGVLWERRLSYETAIYHVRWQDIQQVLGVLTAGAGYTDVLINADTASGNGVEVSLKLQPIDRLSLSVDFGWNDLHFDNDVLSSGAVLFPKGSRPNDSPKYTASASAEYRFPLGGSGLTGVLSASGNYVSPLNITYLVLPGEQGNSLLTTKGSLSIQFPKNWEVNVFVDNANNYRGTQYPLLGIEQWSARQRPRTYGMGFEYHMK